MQAELSARDSPSRSRAPRSGPVGRRSLNTAQESHAKGSHGYDAEVHTPLALHKRQSALSPGSREANVVSLSDATFLLVEVAAEALAVLCMDDPGDVGLGMRDQPEVTSFIAGAALWYDLTPCV